MTQKNRSFKDMLMRAFKAKDADEVEKLAKEAEDAEYEEKEGKKDKETADALRSIDARLKAMDEDIQELKKKTETDDDEEDGDGKNKTDDTVINAETGEKLDDTGVKLYTGDAMKVIAQRAEILAPGTKIPTFDAKTTDAARAKALCACQRKALDTAYATEAGKQAIDPFLAGRSIATLPLHQLNAAFTGASELLRARNNGGGSSKAPTRDFGRTTTVGDINKANREFYAQRANH